MFKNKNIQAVDFQNIHIESFEDRDLIFSASCQILDDLDNPIKNSVLISSLLQDSIEFVTDDTGQTEISLPLFNQGDLILQQKNIQEQVFKCLMNTSLSIKYVIQTEKSKEALDYLHEEAKFISVETHGENIVFTLSDNRIISIPKKNFGEDFNDIEISHDGEKILFHELDRFLTLDNIISPMKAVDILTDKFQLPKDMKYINDRGLQRILKSVDSRDLGILISQEKALMNDLGRNMSKRAYQMLVDEISFMGSVPKREYLRSKSKIERVINQLIEEGEIVCDYRSVYPRPSLIDEDGNFIVEITKSEPDSVLVRLVKWLNL